MRNALIALVLLAAVALGGITVTDRGDHEVLQEMVAGNGAPDTSRIRDVGITYTTVATTYDSIRWMLLNYSVDTIIDSGKFRNSTVPGTYTDTIQDVPRNHVASIADTGAWYRIAVYAHTGADIDSARGTTKWGVGMVFAVWGGSNAITRYNSHEKPPTVASDNSGKRIWLNGSATWNGSAQDNWMFNTNFGCDSCTSWIPSLTNHIIDSAHCLVGITGYAEGGTVMTTAPGYKYWTNRNAADPDDTTSDRIYGKLLRITQDIKPIGFIGLIGQSDVGTGMYAYATHKASWETFLGYLTTDLGYTQKQFTIQCGDMSGDPLYSNLGTLNVQQAQSDLDDSVNTFLAACSYDQTCLDLHHFTHYSQDTIGKRAGNMIATWITSKTSSGYRGPRLNEAHAVTNSIIRCSFSLQTGAKLVMDSVSHIQFKNSYFDSINNVSWEMGADSTNVAVTIMDPFMYNDSVRYGYDRERSDLAIIYDTYGLPAERRAYVWVPVTTVGDSLYADSTYRFWKSDGGDSCWDSTKNWASNSGGSGGATVPGVNNHVVFDVNSNGQKATLQSNVSCKSIFFTSAYKSFFKDKAKNISVAEGFVHDGDSILLEGTTTVANGSYYIGTPKGTQTRKLKLYSQGDGNIICKSLQIGTVYCAYPGKKINISTPSINSGSRILHVMGGNVNIIAYWLASSDSSVAFVVDTVYGSTITGSGGYGLLYIRSGLYGMPATTNIQGLAVNGLRLSFGQTRSESAVTSILQLSGNFYQTNTILPTVFLNQTGAAFRFKTNNYIFSLSTQLIMNFPATSTYQYYDFGSSTVTCHGIKTAGTIQSDTINMPDTLNTTKSLWLHGENIKIISTGVINFVGDSLDSIAVSGLSIGNVVINKSANGTKQVGVARYTDLTLTDGTFTQQAATDTVQAVNATVNTTDAVTNIAPWNISNKLTVATGVTLTVPSLIIGGTTEAPDTLQGAGAGATLDLTGNQTVTWSDPVTVIGMTLAAGDTVTLTTGIDGGGNTGAWIFPSSSTTRRSGRGWLGLGVWIRP